MAESAIDFSEHIKNVDMPQLCPDVPAPSTVYLKLAQPTKS